MKVQETDNDENSLDINDINVSHDAAMSHVDALNEMSWRGKNKIKKQRGKYLVACPDIENIHKGPKYSNAIPLLINGNILQPAKVNNEDVIVKNTCPFDALTQCFIGGYSNWCEYNKYIQQ